MLHCSKFYFWQKDFQEDVSSKSPFVLVQEKEKPCCKGLIPFRISINIRKKLRIQLMGLSMLLYAYLIKLVVKRNMKTNFDINLPSIPGKMIKFKIQDIKNKAFGGQSIRFKDNKVQLTKKFVQSFANFHQQSCQDDSKAQVQTQVSKEQNKRPVQFRVFIADQKKGLSSLKDEIEASKDEVQKPKIGGFTFNKADRINNNQKNQGTNWDLSLTDNYYFTRQQFQKDEAEKKPRKMAIFKNQERNVVYKRLEKCQVPPLGTYEPYAQVKSKKKVQKRKQHHSGFKDEPNYKHFKEIITKVMGNEVPVEEKVEKIEEKIERNEHMFAMDDRDRFGDQIYPIAPKLKTPGPGAYNINAVESIQSKIKKVQVVQEQRKLLKQWFNN